MALTPIAWAIATHAEAHSLHLALVAILLWLLGRRGTARRPLTTPTRRPDATGATATCSPRPIVFGLAVGNHSLTLLLAIPVGLYVLAVDPGDLAARPARPVVRRPARWLTVVLVYLELPLRAGPFRAALVYGTPNTWDGFRYIVLAEQFQGSLFDPFGELPRKFGELVGRTVAQFGILAPLIPVAFVVTAIRRPRYALLTGTAAAITCFFAASYVNADISRYYLGPALMAWTWLAILGGRRGRRSCQRGQPRAGDRRRRGRGAGPDRRRSAPTPAPRGSILAVIIAIALLVPTLVDLPARFRAQST